MTLHWNLERTVVVVVNACDNNTCTYISIVVYTPVIIYSPTRDWYVPNRRNQQPVELTDSSLALPVSVDVRVYSTSMERRCYRWLMPSIVKVWRDDCDCDGDIRKIIYRMLMN